MTIRDAVSPQARDPRPDQKIELHVSSRGIGFGPAAASGLGLRLRISARGRHSAAAGWALWLVGKDGGVFLLNYSMHQLPWGEFDWLSPPDAHEGRKLRLFASRSQLDPTRVSDFVDVDIPDMPPPTEVTARDGSRRVIFTGRTLPGTRVVARLNGRTVESTGKERFQLIMDDVAGGTYAYAVQTLPLGDAAASASVKGSVSVGAPAAIPLAFQFPEVGRRIPRLERVTGVAAPGSEIRVVLGGGEPVTTMANAGGAWEVRRITSEHHGPVLLVAENLTTGEVVQRDVEVEYFPAWQITRLVVGPIVDENGLLARRGTIVEGTGEPGAVIEIAVRNEFVELARVTDDGTWAYRVQDGSSLVTNPVRLRAVGDPVERKERAEQQAPLILHPPQGALVEGDVVVSGVCARPLKLETEDGASHVAKPDQNNNYRWEVKLPALSPGLHTLRAHADPKAVREVAVLTFAVSAPD